MTGEWEINEGGLEEQDKWGICQTVLGKRALRLNEC